MEPPSPCKRNAKIPKDLETIILTAMEKDPARRYANAKAFKDDIARFVNDEAIQARPTTVVYKMTKFLRKHRKIVLPSAAALVIAIASFFMFYGERTKELFTWRLVFKENFAYTNINNVTNNWTFYHYPITRVPSPEPIAITAFNATKNIAIRSNALIMGFSTRWEGLYYNRELHGNFRVDWELTSPNPQPRFYICGKDLFDGYTFHIGWDGRWVLTRGVQQSVLDYIPRTNALAASKKHRFRMEKEGKFVRLFINGERIFNYYDYDEIVGTGHRTFGFNDVVTRTFLRIENIRVYSMPFPRKVSSLAVPDRAFVEKRYADAAVQYSELAEIYPHTDIGREAMFKFGVSRIRSGESNEGYAVLEKFEKDDPNHHMAPFSMYERSIFLSSRGMTNEVLVLYRALASRFPKHSVLKNIYHRVSDQWLSQLQSKSNASREDMIAFFDAGRSAIRTTAQIFELPLQGNSFQNAAIRQLVIYGEYQKIVDDYPDERAACATALLNLGRAEDVLSHYPEQRFFCAVALMILGRFEDVLMKYPDQRTACASALNNLGRLEEILSSYPEQRDRCAWVLINLSREEEVLSNYSDMRRQCADALSSLGRAEEVLKKHPDQRAACAWALIHLGREKEVLLKYPEQRRECFYSLLFLRRTQEALTNYAELATFMVVAKSQHGLEEYIHTRSMREMSSVTNMPFDYGMLRWYYFSYFFIIPLLQTINGQPDALRDFCNEAVSNHKSHFVQMMYFDAAYILGNVSEEEFLNQPMKQTRTSRLIIAKAMRAEYLGKPKDARVWYTKWLALQRWQTMEDPVLEMFVKWRAKELGGARK
ncbi:MAG: hypothetical protein AABZ39_16720 [Spirochaetota bacterium]|mgnify:CR=1 FL=1